MEEKICDVCGKRYKKRIFEKQEICITNYYRPGVKRIKKINFCEECMRKFKGMIEMGVDVLSEDYSAKAHLKYGEFYKIRELIAYKMNENLGNAYRNLCFAYHDDKMFKEAERRLNVEADKVQADYQDVVNFLYAPDTGGCADAITCKKILKILINTKFKDKEENSHFYMFKHVLFTCCVKEKGMIWY